MNLINNISVIIKSFYVNRCYHYSHLQIHHQSKLYFVIVSFDYYTINLFFDLTESRRHMMYAHTDVLGLYCTRRKHDSYNPLLYNLFDTTLIKSFCSLYRWIIRKWESHFFQSHQKENHFFSIISCFIKFRASITQENFFYTSHFFTIHL